MHKEEKPRNRQVETEERWPTVHCTRVCNGQQQRGNQSCSTQRHCVMTRHQPAPAKAFSQDMPSVLSSLERCRHTGKQIMRAQQEIPGAGWNDRAGPVGDAGVGGHHPSSQQDSGAWSCRRLHWRMDAGMRASLWECSL